MRFYGWAHGVNLILASFDRLDNNGNSLKCLGQPAQISLDSAVLAVRPAIIDKRRVQPVGTIFQLAFRQCLCSVVFWPQVGLNKMLFIHRNHKFNK